MDEWDRLVADMQRIETRSDIRNESEIKEHPKNDKDYLSMNSRYDVYPLETKNFHHIIKAKGAHNKKLAFVDGGNCILFNSAAFCVGYIRTACIIYERNERKQRQKKEFYAFISSRNEKLVVSTYPANSFDGLEFDPQDSALMDGTQRCSPSKIISVIRRLAELQYALDASEDCDYICLDGTLEARYPLEIRYLEKFESKKLCALSKTCTLTTRKGESVVRKIDSMFEGMMTKNEDESKSEGLRSENKGKGIEDVTNIRLGYYYHPCAKSNNPLHDADIIFLKLNQKSHYVFRFEVKKDSDNSSDISELLEMLCLNSNDPVFLGYPYGLIDVDQYARVSDEEASLLKTKISVKMGKNWNEFSKNLTSTNAHEILDNIRF